MNARVLIVDDDPNILQLLERCVPEGSEVRTAKNSFKALQLMEQFRPDVILLDVDMPGISGLEFLDIMHEDSRWDYVRVVVVSGRLGEEDRLQAYEHGADDFLAKPFEPREVAWKVRSWSRFSRRIEESQAANEFFQVMADGELSPFVSVATAAQLLRDIEGIDTRPDLLDPILAMETSCEAYVKRLNLFLEFVERRRSAIHSGQTFFAFALDSLLKPLIAQWEQVCRERSLQFTADEVPPDLTVRADSKSLKRLVRWVLHNAVRYARSAVALRVSVVSDAVARIDVQDDGPGFTADRVPRVFGGFEPGNRLNLDVGMGLHLSLGREFLTGQGGALTIADPGPHTTTVRLTLPR